MGGGTKNKIHVQINPVPLSSLSARNSSTALKNLKVDNFQTSKLIGYNLYTPQMNPIKLGHKVLKIKSHQFFWRDLILRTL